MQKWVLRIIYKKPLLFRSNELYKLAKVLDIRQLCCFNLITKVHKEKDQLITIDHEHNTRQKDNTNRLPKIEKAVGRRSSAYLGPKLYNFIPKEYKILNNKSQLPAFKKKIKSWILNKNRNIIHNLFDPKIEYTARL